MAEHERLVEEAEAKGDSGSGSSSGAGGSSEALDAALAKVEALESELSSAVDSHAAELRKSKV